MQGKKGQKFYIQPMVFIFKGAPIKNWLLYYPVEKWLSHTDCLITINDEDYECAMRKKFKAGSIKS